MSDVASSGLDSVAILPCCNGDACWLPPAVRWCGTAAQSTPVGPGDTEGFFPDSVGDTWFFETTTGTNRCRTADARLRTDDRHRHPIFGRSLQRSLRRRRRTTRAAHTRRTTPRTAMRSRLGNNDPSDTLTAAIVPYVEGGSRRPRVITSISRSGVDYGEDLDGDGRTSRWISRCGSRWTARGADRPCRLIRSHREAHVEHQRHPAYTRPAASVHGDRAVVVAPGRASSGS